MAPPASPPHADPGFDRFGPVDSRSPVVLSVPHAGRAYPQALIDAIRVPLAALLPLEDRHVDSIAHAAHQDEALLVARRPRAWIDMNRSEQERDPRIDDGASAKAMPAMSARLRGGLGLVPRRAGASGEFWARRLGADEVMARIVADHRPYHRALADALAAARSRFGGAILIDVHSMPSLGGVDAAQIVIGDRFGRSAAARLTGLVDWHARAAGLRTALNAPYAGGYILDAHADPARDVHAIQIEFDRALYLDPATMEATAGVQRLGGLLRTIIAALAADLAPLATAAE